MEYGHININMQFSFHIIQVHIFSDVQILTVKNMVAGFVKACEMTPCCLLVCVCGGVLTKNNDEDMSLH